MEKMTVTQYANFVGTKHQNVSLAIKQGFIKQDLDGFIIPTSSQSIAWATYERKRLSVKELRKNLKINSQNVCDK